MIAVYREAILQKNKRTNENTKNDDSDDNDNNNNNNNINGSDATTVNNGAAADAAAGGALDVALLIPAHLKERVSATSSAFIENRKEASDWPPRIGEGRSKEPIIVAAALVLAENGKIVKEKLRKITEVEILHRIHTFDLTGK